MSTPSAKYESEYESGYLCSFFIYFLFFSEFRIFVAVIVFVVVVINGLTDWLIDYLFRIIHLENSSEVSTSNGPCQTTTTKQPNVTAISARTSSHLHLLFLHLQCLCMLQFYFICCTETENQKEKKDEQKAKLKPQLICPYIMLRYTYIHAYIHTCIHTNMWTYTYTHTHTFTYINKNLYAYTLSSGMYELCKHTYLQCTITAYVKILCIHRLHTVQGKNNATIDSLLFYVLNLPLSSILTNTNEIYNLFNMFPLYRPWLWTEEPIGQ